MTTHIQFLENAASYFRKHSWAVLLLETASSVGFGAALGAVITKDVSPWYAVLTGVIWVLFEYFKFAAQHHFPSAILDDLIAHTKLNSAQQDLARRNTVLGFVSESVTILNKETCRLENADDAALCAGSIRDGLQTVLRPLVERPQEILGCVDSKFSVFIGVRSDYLSNHPDQFFQLRDDFGVENVVGQNLMQDGRASGFRLSAQEAVRRAFNENKMFWSSDRHGEHKLAIMVSPLPVVCDPQHADGVLMIFTNCGHQYPSDLEGTLKIYGQIVSNWRWHYSECEHRAKHGYRTSDVMRAVFQRETSAGEMYSETDAPAP
jgi:hypothetical protein